MFNAERLLGQLMGQAMGGQLGGRKKKRRGGFGMPSGGQMAVGLGVLGVAMAAYERTRWVFLQPVLVSMLTVIGILAYYAVVLAERRVLHYLPSAERRVA